MNISRFAALVAAGAVSTFLLVGCGSSDDPNTASPGIPGLESSAVAQPVAASSDKDSIVTAKLIADTTAVKPGTTFTLGILYKISPDWHIYYKSPGGSGFATTVNWNLPEGAAVGETLYPAPITFESPGPIISYGYEGEALLMVEAMLAEAPADGNAAITAKSRWLMCSDRCIPNNAELSLSLPVGDPQPANQAIFDKYRKQLPQAAEALPAPARLAVSAAGSVTTFELTITPPEGKKLVAEGHGDVHAAQFYPADQDGYVIDPPTVTGEQADAGGVKVYEGPVKITWTAEPGSNSAEALQRVAGTLVYQFRDGSNNDEPVLLELDYKL